MLSGWLQTMNLPSITTLCSQYISDRSLQFRKDDTAPAEDDVPYGYGFFHFVFATGAMYFAMLLIGWNSHHSMRKYGGLLPSCIWPISCYLHLTEFSCFSSSQEKKMRGKQKKCISN